MATYGGRGLHAEIVRTVATRVTSGKYAENEVIRPEDLEEEFAISRTVVREVFKVLAAKGMVKSIPKRGTSVALRHEWNLLDPDLMDWRKETPDLAFLRDLSEVRLIIEPAGARLAALRRTLLDLELIDEALVSMESLQDSPTALIEADLLFHRALLNAAHNELLTRMEVVIDVGLRVRDQIVHGKGRPADSHEQHVAIAVAIRNSQADAAAAAMRHLLEQAMKDSDETLAERPGNNLPFL